jgi:hypothetical protein
MLRHVVIAVLLVGSTRIAAADETDCACDVTPAACDTGCACDSECAYDWSADECAAADSGCLPEAPDADEPALETTELAQQVDADPIDWAASAPDVACADGATNQGGHCIASASATAASGGGGDVSGGCAATTPGLVVGAAVLALIVLARRRRLLLVLGFGACMVGDVTWDDAVENGPPGDPAAYLDVYGADLGDGGAQQFLLANQELAAGALEPAAQFSLARAQTAHPIYRVAGTCGDRLVVAAQDGPGAELLGWAHDGGADGTAELIELAAPDGCTFAYETDPDEIADLEAAGYTRAGSLGQVWPPGPGDAQVADDDTASEAPDATPAACHLKSRHAIELLYASPGGDESLELLKGCVGEVIVGEKDENGATGPMTTAAARAAGGRTAFVVDRNGDKLRALLARSNGVERTAAYLRAKLAHGYDYIVIDEITGAGDYADGQTFNRRVRELLLRVPAKKLIPYFSIDLTQELPTIYMNDRRMLLRAFEKRGRAIALEVYLHTGQVMAGDAPGVFRRAADRIANAVRGLAGTGGINLHAFTTIGTSMHSTFAQYRYLDQPSHDLAAITREVSALRHGSKRVRQQKGVGWYFVNKSDMAPKPHTYTYAQLIARLRTQALRFK